MAPPLRRHELLRAELVGSVPPPFGPLPEVGEGRGPINGYPINLNVLLASRDPVALDATGMRLLGLGPVTSRHVLHAQGIGLGTAAAEAIAMDGPFAEVRVRAEPAVEDRAIKVMNQVSRSPLLTKHLLLNDSIFYPVRRAVAGLRHLARRLRRRPAAAH
jgi:hypothetical protein